MAPPRHVSFLEQPAAASSPFSALAAQAPSGGRLAALSLGGTAAERLLAASGGGESPGTEQLIRELSEDQPEGCDVLATMAAAAARAAVVQCDDGEEWQFHQAAADIGLQSMLPQLQRASLTLHSNDEGGSTCTVELVKQQQATVDLGLGRHTREVCLQLPSECTSPSTKADEGLGPATAGSCTFNVTFKLPPSASEERILEHFVQLLGQRLAAERRHLAKQQLEESLDAISEGISRGGSLDLGAASREQLSSILSVGRRASMDAAAMQLALARSGSMGRAAEEGAARPRRSSGP